MADRALLLDENQALFAQNNEKRTRSTRHIVVGSAKVRSDDNILAAQAKRDARVSVPQSLCSQSDRMF